MEQLAEILKDLYARSVNDNMDDFQKMYFVVTKLVTMLKLKGYLTEADQKFILKIEDVKEKAENK